MGASSQAFSHTMGASSQTFSHTMGASLQASPAHYRCQLTSIPCTPRVPAHKHPVHTWEQAQQYPLHTMGAGSRVSCAHHGCQLTSIPCTPWVPSHKHPVRTREQAQQSPSSGDCKGAAPPLQWERRKVNTAEDGGFHPWVLYQDQWAKVAHMGTILDKQTRGLPSFWGDHMAKETTESVYKTLASPWSSP